MVPPDVLTSQGRRWVTAHAGAALSSPQRKALRQELKQRRTAIPNTERELAAHAVLEQLRHWRPFTTARHIAAYDAVAAELPTATIQAHIQQRGKALYLPALPNKPTGRLRFVPSDHSSSWHLNRYAIPEPVEDRQHPARNPSFINLILVPLVGFDDRGNRMGMGAGYYDRTLAFRMQRRHWRKPMLVGLAYACQQVDALPAESWDVPLDAIITEHGIITPA